MVQTIIVTIIVTLAIAYVAYKIYMKIHSFNDPCAGCSGCEIHRQLMEKRKECNKNQRSGCKK
jgi:hypothetical protein